MLPLHVSYYSLVLCIFPICFLPVSSHESLSSTKAWTFVCSVHRCILGALKSVWPVVAPSGLGLDECCLTNAYCRRRLTQASRVADGGQLQTESLTCRGMGRAGPDGETHALAMRGCRALVTHWCVMPQRAARPPYLGLVRVPEGVCLRTTAGGRGLGWSLQGRAFGRGGARGEGCWGKFQGRPL